MAHYWKQPLNLSFNGGTSKTGGAIEVDGSYKLMVKQKSRLKYLSLDMGMTYKTAGFLPEETALDRHLGLRLGISLGLQGN